MIRPGSLFFFFFFSLSQCHPGPFQPTSPAMPPCQPRLWPTKTRPHFCSRGMGWRGWGMPEQLTRKGRATERGLHHRFFLCTTFVALLSPTTLPPPRLKQNNPTSCLPHPRSTNHPPGLLIFFLFSFFESSCTLPFETDHRPVSCLFTPS